MLHIGNRLLLFNKGLSHRFEMEYFYCLMDKVTTNISNIPMNKIIISILLILVFNPVYSSNNSTYRNKLYAIIDSCNAGYIDLTGALKKQMTILARNSGDNRVLSTFFQKQKQYGSASQCNAQHAMSENNLDSVYYYYKEAIANYENYEKQDSYIQLPSLQNDMIYWCVNNGYYEVAIKTVDDMKHFVIENQLTDNILWTYQLLSLVYMMMDKPTESIKVSKEGLNLNTGQTKTRISWSAKSALYQQIIQSFTALDEYEKSLIYCDSLIDWVSQMPSYDYKPSNLKAYQDINYYMVYLWSSENLLRLNNLNKAKQMLDKAKEKFEDVRLERFYSEDVLNSLNSLDAIFHYHIGDFKTAIEYTETSMNYLKQANRYPEYLKNVIFLSDIYTRMGNYKQSNELRNIALQVSDSLNKVNVTKDINSLWTILEVDRARMEKEQSELKNQKLYAIILGISIIVLHLAGSIIILIENNKKLKAKNKKLFDQQKVDDMVDADNNPDELYTNGELSLYDRLVNYITLSQQYINPDISRESVAKELGTNRQYITEAIQQNRNMSFPEFINNYRLKHACKLLLNKKNLRIKEVYLDSGFNNRTTFTRLFREKYGMTPSEFKQCADNDLK